MPPGIVDPALFFPISFEQYLRQAEVKLPFFSFKKMFFWGGEYATAPQVRERGKKLAMHTPIVARITCTILGVRDEGGVDHYTIPPTCTATLTGGPLHCVPSLHLSTSRTLCGKNGKRRNKDMIHDNLCPSGRLLAFALLRGS